MTKVLVIDDERSIRNSLREILEYEKYNVDEAADGGEALEKIADTLYDVILCDIKMPNIDGSEVLEKGMDINRRPVYYDLRSRKHRNGGRITEKRGLRLP
ncbi:MAG: response regulator [Bacteroidales bacterium]|nr:response regulator [Bacteroidales bacterium]